MKNNNDNPITTTTTTTKTPFPKNANECPSMPMNAPKLIPMFSDEPTKTPLN